MVGVGLAFSVFSCSASKPAPADDPILGGGISYPFVDESKPLGYDQPAEKLVIRSSAGDREYAVEIPGAARDFDVEVPLGELTPHSDYGAPTGRPKSGGGRSPNPVTTDREVVAALPRLDKARPTDTAIMDGAFGVGPAEGPRQSPSYTLGLARVGEHYKRRSWEHALIEINDLLAYYPTSAQLHKMKGTVLVKMRSLALAELAWIRALELTPEDKALRAALDRLQKRIVALGHTPQGNIDIPKAVGTPEVKKEAWP